MMEFEYWLYIDYNIAVHVQMNWELCIEKEYKIYSRKVVAVKNESLIAVISLTVTSLILGYSFVIWSVVLSLEVINLE